MARAIWSVRLTATGDAAAQSLSEPLPAIVDPRPGPFFAWVDDAGRPLPEADGAIAAAASPWLYEPLDHFLLCHHPASGRDGRAGFDAVRAVAARLKAHGATGIVTLPGATCPPDLAARQVVGGHVTILGIVLL